MPFRLEHITLDERVELGCRCLLSAGQYGLVTSLSRQYGTSRQFLYNLRDRTQEALLDALQAGKPGRPWSEQGLLVDRLAVERTILVLSQVAQASTRAIQASLKAILAVPRSLGYIEGVLQEAARRARLLTITPPQPVQAELDEVFAGRRPTLEVVDHRSGAVLALVSAASRDDTSWGCTLLDLQAQQVTLETLTADGAEGARTASRLVGLPEPGLDHWHTLRDLGRSSHLLDLDAYRRMALADKSLRAAASESYLTEHGRRPRGGRPLKVPTDPVSVRRAVEESEDAIRRADGVRYLLEVVKEVLEPLDPRTGRVRGSEEVKAELVSAAALLRELGVGAVKAAKVLEDRAEALVGYLVTLQARLRGPRELIGEDGVSLMAWAWRHRVGLGLADPAEAWPDQPEVARQVWAALEATVRTTGMAENLNSVLALHRAAHRGLPSRILAVFQVYRNRQVFARGKRAGSSPLEILGLPSEHWLVALGYGRPANVQQPSQLATASSRTVNTLAA